jgi:adenylate cyclase
MQRVFWDRQGNEIDEIDLWNYGYDARKRSWYWQTMRSDRPYVSAPYLSFSLGALVITVSAPLRGKVPGVLAADLKLDTFSDFVQAQRPGQNGTVMIFDEAGSLIAHRDFAEFVAAAMTHPSQSQCPASTRSIPASRLRCCEAHAISTRTRGPFVVTTDGITCSG